MRISEAMTRNPACCTPDSSLADCARMMADCDCGAIPVVRDQSAMHPVGVITDRDIVIRSLAKGRNPMEMTVRDAMTESTVTIAQDKSLRDAADLMKEHKVRRLMVTDETGKIVGMLAQADLAREGKDKLTGDTVEEISEPVGQTTRMTF